MISNRSAVLFFAMFAAGGPASAATLPGVPPAPSALTSIGIAAAVRGDVQASAPGTAAGRVIGSGKPVYLNDHVTTGADGRLQILLLDETVFTIGPNSDMVLDEFVYDPKTNAGKVSAQIAKGVFRFVTGKVAQHRPADMKVALPVGTIGIRGTMVAGRVSGGDADVFLVGPGQQNNAHERPGGITVTNGHGSTAIDATGYGTSIHNGGAPSGGYRFSADQVRGILGQLDNRTGSNSGGGASGHAGGGLGGSGTADAGGAGTPGGPSGSGPTGGAPGAAQGVNGTAGQSSGQNTATVSYTPAGTVNVGLQNNNNNTTTTNNTNTTDLASQQTQVAVNTPTVDTLAEGGSSYWQDIVKVTSGLGTYSSSGLYGCTGGTCGKGAVGNFSFKMVVDFANQQLGGHGSNIIVGPSLSYLPGGGAVNNPVTGSGTTIGLFGFPTSVGAAVAVIPTTALSNSNFNGSNVSFQNVGGTAGQLTMNMVYALGSTAANGSATANPVFTTTTPVGTSARR